VPGRTAKNLLGQAPHCRVVELHGWIGFQECGKTPSELRHRTLHCRKRRDRFCLCGPVKIQEHLVRRRTTPAARTGPAAAGPRVRGCVVVVAHGLVDVMRGCNAVVHARRRISAREGIATGNKPMNSVDVAAARFACNPGSARLLGLRS